MPKTRLDKALAIALEAYRLSRQQGQADVLQATAEWLRAFRQDVRKKGMMGLQSGDPNLAVQLHKWEIQVCRETDDLSELAVALVNSARALEKDTRPAEAMDLLTEAEQILAKIDDRKRLLAALELHANLCYQNAKDDRALELLLQQERIARSLKETKLLWGALYYQAVIWACDKQQPAKALPVAKQPHALSIGQKDQEAAKRIKEFVVAIQSGKLV